MCTIQHSLKRFIDFRLWFIVSAPAPLFHHHFDFFGELFIRQLQVCHTVSFEFE